MYEDNEIQSQNFLRNKMIKKRIGDYLTLTSNLKLDLARLPPCFGNLLLCIFGVNHRLAFYNRAEETYIEAPNPYEGKQD